MIAIEFTERFRRSATKLPNEQKKKLRKLLLLFRENPYHPQLHTKQLSAELSGLFAFRITRDWRVIFQFISATEIKLIDVGNRKDIYK